MLIYGELTSYASIVHLNGSYSIKKQEDEEITPPYLSLMHKNGGECVVLSVKTKELRKPSNNSSHIFSTSSTRPKNKNDSAWASDKVKLEC